MTAIAVSYASERFDQIKEGNTKTTTYTMNRRATKIHQLQQVPRTLKKQYKTSSDDEKETLTKLQNIPWKKLMTLRRAEWHWGYREIEPGHLWRIWRRGRVAGQWRRAEGVWIPKEENSKNMDQFQSISLLSVEGNIFFSIISSRLTEFLLKNNYIDHSEWKGGIPGVPSCLEYTGVVKQLISEAHESKGDLVVLWTWSTPSGPYCTNWSGLQYTSTMFPVRSRIWSWITTIISGWKSLQKHQTGTFLRKK